MNSPETIPGWTSTCELHRRHTPVPWLLVLHHVRPKSWGGLVGPNVRDNTRLAIVCPTGHYNIHAALDMLFEYDGPQSVPSLEAVRIGERTWDLALEGWNSTPPGQRDGRTL